MWLAGTALAIILFLPGLQQWGLHGQSGLCRLALFDQYQHHPQFRWFAVISSVNFLFSIFIMLGILMLHKHMPAYSISLAPSERWIFVSAHMVAAAGKIGAVPWLVLGVATLLAKSGVSEARSVQDSIVVFVLPLSAALHPLICMWKLVSLLQRQTYEQKLVLRVKSQNKM